MRVTNRFKSKQFCNSFFQIFIMQYFFIRKGQMKKIVISLPFCVLVRKIRKYIVSPQSIVYTYLQTFDYILVSHFLYVFAISDKFDSDGVFISKSLPKKDQYDVLIPEHKLQLMYLKVYYIKHTKLT